ncbi:MAG: hypothetical protein CVV27_12030 [Candidatus Melainabacteria bacterium HGW-Melainabacteria-1]|nr:MAG: hypothetical protein CVV27_12030 [Candidatus Melainabacteria bacterium HGW-Melainabacteria-1]
MIYLDTHVLVWLYAGQTELLSPKAYQLVNTADLYVSPLVQLELCYLHEVGRILDPAQPILTELGQSLGLRLCARPYAAVVEQAMQQSWTRDPFDRLIVGQAAVDNNPLISKDRQILAHYPHAVWD